MYLSLFSGFLYKFLFILYFHQIDYGVSRCVCAHAHVRAHLIFILVSDLYILGSKV